MKTEAILTAGLAAALVTAAAPAPPAAARTLDRRSAVRAAMQQNPQVAAARAEEAAMQAEGRQADAARWPLVTFDAGVGPSLKATLVPGTAVTSVERQYHDFRFSDLSAVFLGNLTLIQPLYTFGKIALRQEAAAHGLRARAAQTRMERADVALAVARIYEGYLFARDEGRFLDEIAHWLERTREGTQERLSRKQPNISDRDVLRLQSGLGLVEIGQHQAEAAMSQATAGIVAYLNLPRGEAITFAEDQLAIVGDVPPSFDALVALAAKNRPELIALHEGESALDALGRAESAGYKPDIVALASISGAYTPGRDWIETRFVVDPLNNFVPFLAVGLRWQIQAYMAGARAQEQHARADVLRHLGEWADAGIPAEVRLAYEDVLRTRKDVASGETANGKAKQWMVEASADYSIGLLDVREVTDAAEAYVRIRTALLNARFEQNVAMAALSRATGTLDGDSATFYLAAAGADPPAGGDADAEATVRKAVDDAFTILKDKSLATPNQRRKRITKLREVADRTFDWSTMARSSLGAPWRSMNPAQRTRFVDVFKDVLAAQYSDDIDHFQGTEKVTVDSSSREGEEVVVKTTLVTDSHERVPMDYRMQKESGQWKVVDLSIENVSLVNHFRKTFSAALGNMTPNQLIDRLQQQLPKQP
ncbi:MAG TPA: ABC transporter substrate-binding protein [Polyangia bacterium]|jgi:phospholipid transport system substrate-binding protein